MSDDAAYRAGMRLLSEGHVLEACDHFQSALDATPGDSALHYGLLLARSRATPGATLSRELDAVLAAQAADAPWYWRLLSIKARLLKAEGETRADKLAESADLYLRAHEISGDVYPGVNAATLMYISGRPGPARELARGLAARLPAEPDNYWDAATLGELCVLLDAPAAALEAYARADRLSVGNHGDRASMRRQLRMLAAHGTALAARILESSFARPDVVVFSGHRIDAADARVPRFPASAIPRVERELESFCAGLTDCASFSSAAAGGDILFLEAMLARGAKVHVVLPFPAAEFIASSVADAGEAWVGRFERVLERATRVIVASHAISGTPDVLYHYANLLGDGLAHLYADSIDGRLQHCALLSASARGAALGGTRHEVERWRARGYALRLIEPLPDARDGSVAVPAPENAQATQPSATGGLTIRAMVFADLVGSSRFAPEELPALLMFFLAEANRFLAEEGLVPWLRNTWGDGLFLVFDTVDEAARFAVRLVNGVRWPGPDDGRRPTVRVGLHAGPVVEAHDAILERNNVFGHHVIRAARVEPVTPPGVVFATEEAASLLRATSDRRFDCVYMGRISMPKGFGQTPIYRIDLD